MDTAMQFLKSLDLKSDFVAQSYNEWQLHQVKQKPFNLVRRLKSRKAHECADVKADKVQLKK